MTTLYEPEVGKWWRAERYELRDGLIRSVPSAAVHDYDPWGGFRRARDAGQPAPYESLFDMVRQLEIVPGGASAPVTISARSEGLLTGWCSENGLLGTLPHRVRSVALTPRWRQAKEVGLGQIIASWGKDYVLVPVLEQLFLGSGGWTRTGRPYIAGGEGIVTTENREDEGGVVPADLRDPSWPVPGVVIARGRGQFQSERLSASWYQHFPEVPLLEAETFSYPTPGTRAFFEAYAEPLDEFLGIVGELRRALALLGEITPLENATRDVIDHVNLGQRTLDELASSISPSIWPQADGTFRLAWPTPSLIGAYAFMAMRDLEGQRRLLVCAVCSRPFVTKAYQAKYCSEKCRHTGQKRAQRERQREITR